MGVDFSKGIKLLENTFDWKKIPTKNGGNHEG